MRLPELPTPVAQFRNIAVDEAHRTARLQRQQAFAAQQDLRVLRPTDDLAQTLGKHVE
jgi:hypothetical protein